MTYDNFEWDEEKNENNIKKHGISFKEATEAFYDEHALIFPDEKHSTEEERFIVIGFSEKDKLLFVSHCYREKGDIIRIISARIATRMEQKKYHTSY